MKVLVVSQYFPPEIGATQNRLYTFARALAESGADVDVLTEMPNHPAGVIAPEYDGRWFDESTMDGFRVVRVRVSVSPNKTFVTRLAFYFSFAAMALAARRRLARQYDVVLATSPPLPAAAAGLLLARRTRARFVLDVRDLWPAAAVALGELRNPLLRRAAERMERWLYRHSSRVLVTTTAFVADLTSRGVPAGHIVHVPNGARLDVFRPDVETAGVRGPLGLDGHFVVTYAGLHGIAQDLETVLDAAARLAPDNRFRFLFIGDGPRKVALESTARSMGLANVTFMAAVPVETCAAYLAASDVLLVPLAANVLFRMFVPSKLFDGLACGRPVVLMVDGEARAILERSGGGRFVPPGDAAALASTLTAMADHPAGLAEMGARGRTFVETHYSREAQARDVVRTVREVAGLAEAS